MAGIKDRLIQFILRGKDELSPEAKKSAEALEALRQEADALGKTLDQAKDARGLARALESTQRAVDQSQRSLEQTELRVTELREALSANPEAAGLQQSLKDAEREASRTRKQLLSLNTALAEQEAAAKAAGIDTNNLADEEKRLAAEVDKAKGALGENSQQLKALQREQAAASRSAAEHTSRIAEGREAMSRGARQVLAFAAAYISLNAAFGLVRRGLGLVAQGIRSVATAGSDEQQALGQLEAALASTGRQAEFTTEQLQRMADELEDGSMRTAEEIQSAQARLLSYTDVAAKEFPRAMQIIIDQQQRLGISVEQSAEIVGRALQSPSEAIATLGRQGFKFEADQKRLLRQLEATGKKAEAQAVIMDMLSEAYGGAAAAAKMGTFAGLLKTIDKQVGDFTKRVMNSGAFEYMQRKLLELSDRLDEMAKDGRLDRIAQSLSDAFVNGAEAVAKYAERLATVDFEALAARAARAAEQIGPAIEQTVESARYVTATLTTVWNAFAGTVNAAGAALVLVVQQTIGRLGLAIGQIADMFGNSDLRAKADGLYNFLGELSMSYAQQAKSDFGQIAAAWDTTTEHIKRKAREQTETVSLESVSQADYVRQAVTSMQGALDQISAAKTVSTLRQIGEEMYAAYKRGDISQQEYAASSVELNKRLKELGGAVTSVSTAAGIAAESLKSLADVQRAISDAKTDRDITAIRTALKRLYDDGLLGATDYNAELVKLTARQKELKGAVEQGTKAQADKNAVDKEAIVTSEQLRRESGKRMEAERRAGDQAMQNRRKGTQEAERDMSAFSDFFGGVISRAREPLAALSAAALAAYDKLRGVTSVDLSMDTSDLDATTQSLTRAREELGKLQAQANTVGMSGFGRWMTQTQVQSQQIQVQYLAQKASLQQLMAGYEAGSITLENFVRRAGGATNSLSLLDKADLSSLESALESAKQRMEQLGDSTRGTLESLQMELLQLQGTQEEIERARFDSRRNELRAQQAQAQTAGDSAAASNLRKALQTLDEIETATANKRLQDAQQKRTEEAAKAAPTQVQAQQPAKVIQLVGPRGQAVNVPLQDDRDETKLLNILADAGLRSL